MSCHVRATKRRWAPSSPACGSRDLDDADWRASRTPSTRTPCWSFPASTCRATSRRRSAAASASSTRSWRATAARVPISNLRPDGTHARRARTRSWASCAATRAGTPTARTCRSPRRRSILSAEVVATTRRRDRVGRHARGLRRARARRRSSGSRRSPPTTRSCTRRRRSARPRRAASSTATKATTPPLRPLVKRHPVTGRRSLFIGRHAYGIPGLAEAESERLLDELLAFACQPPRVFAHRWQAGDVAIWDNRCVLHRARPWDPAEPRVMHHTRIAGDPATESGTVGRETRRVKWLASKPPTR